MQPLTGRDRIGLVLGVIGMIGFSITLPATRIAVAELDATFVGFGRAVVASLVAGAWLLVERPALPTRRQFGGLMIVAAGVVLGFPVLSAVAMRSLPASHGAVVIALIPLATALASVWRNGERPSRRFWLAGGLGSGIVIAFTALAGAGAPQRGDLLLLAGVVVAAVGYAEGGRLARELGGMRVIAWALLIAAPVAVVPAAFAVARHGLAASPGAWVGFGYVCLISQFLAFIAWYNGLAIGGVARVSQTQLLQPFFTITASALLIGERLDPGMVIAAALVVLCVALGRKAPVRNGARREKRGKRTAGIEDRRSVPEITGESASVVPMNQGGGRTYL